MERRWSTERELLKIKRIRTADCVVGGFRYGAGSKLVGSLLLGLYDEAGKLHHVGFTSALAEENKPELTRRLEALADGPGFYRPSAWWSEPLVDGADRALRGAAPRAGGGSVLRPCERRALPARDAVTALAS